MSQLKKLYIWWKLRKLREAIKIYDLFLEERKKRKAGTQNFKTWANLMELSGKNLLSR